MGLLDFFSSDPTTFDTTEAPSIGGIQADVTSFNDIVNGKGNAADYGTGIGAGIGAYFGDPQEGASIGRTVLPILNNLWHNIAK